jgi:hypothetical protein
MGFNSVFKGLNLPPNRYTTQCNYHDFLLKSNTNINTNNVQKASMPVLGSPHSSTQVENCLRMCVVCRENKTGNVCLA